MAVTGYVFLIERNIVTGGKHDTWTLEFTDTRQQAIDIIKEKVEGFDNIAISYKTRGTIVFSLTGDSTLLPDSRITYDVKYVTVAEALNIIRQNNN